MRKIKESATQVATSTKNVVTNGEQFIQAVALVTIAAFSYWALQQVKVSRVLYWAVVAALVVVGLRGAIEVVKFLDKKN